MALSGEGYFPKRDWLARMPGSKTEHEDVIDSNADAKEEGVKLHFQFGSVADDIEAMYAAALDNAYVGVHGGQNPELTMPVSEALRRLEEEVGVTAVAAEIELPGEQAA